MKEELNSLMFGGLGVVLGFSAFFYFIEPRVDKLNYENWAESYEREGNTEIAQLYRAKADSIKITTLSTLKEDISPTPETPEERQRRLEELCQAYHIPDARFPIMLGPGF